MDYRADIDGLRALAVSVVILFHLDVSWLPGGFVGVDVFFVISGFLITSLIMRRIEAGDFSLANFYERRFRRIYPNLLIVVAATAVLGWIALMPETYRFFGRTTPWAALSVSNFAFIGGRGYFDPASIDKPLLHTWSLGVEEQFYLVFPWLLMLAARRRYCTARLIAASVALSLALSVTAGLANWAPSYFLLPTRFWELGMGALVAVLPLDALLTPLRRTILGLFGLAAILWACLSLSESDSFPGYLALAPVLGATALILANGSAVNRVMALAPFAWIGRLSYALYLWHWPLISVGAAVGFSTKDASTRIAVIALSLTLSFVGYYLWEMPVRRRQFLRTRRTLFVALSLSAALLVSAGILIFVARGFPQRLPKELFDVYENTRETSRLVLKQCPRDDSRPYSCPLGAKDSTRVSFIILGDSHSEAVASEIGVVAEQYGLHGLFLGKSGCKLLVQSATQKNQECVLQNEFSKEQFKKYNPELVILINYWPSLDKENGYTREGNGPVLTNNPFDKTLDFFGKTHIIVPFTVPVYDTIISRVSWHAWFRSRLGLSEVSYPTIPLEQYRGQQAPVQELLTIEKSKHTNLGIIDPAEVFCPNKICVSVLGGKPLYYDTDHLSHTGALLYASMFRGYFQELAQQLSDRPYETKPETTSDPAPPSNAGKN